MVPGFQSRALLLIRLVLASGGGSLLLVGPFCACQNWEIFLNLTVQCLFWAHLNKTSGCPKSTHPSNIRYLVPQDLGGRGTSDWEVTLGKWGCGHRWANEWMFPMYFIYWFLIRCNGCEDRGGEQNLSSPESNSQHRGLPKTFLQKDTSSIWR